jgi:hypothetical protein
MTSLMTHDQAEAVIVGARGRGPLASSAPAGDELRELTDALAALRTSLVDGPPPAPTRELRAWLAPGRRMPRAQARPVAWWRRAARTIAGLGLGVQLAIGAGAGAAVAVGIAHEQGLLPGAVDPGRQPARRPEPVQPTPAGPRHQPTAHPHPSSSTPASVETAPAATSGPTQHDPAATHPTTGQEQEQEQEPEPEHVGTSTEPADQPTTGDDHQNDGQDDGQADDQSGGGQSDEADQPEDGQSDGSDGSEGPDRSDPPTTPEVDGLP